MCSNFIVPRTTSNFIFHFKKFACMRFYRDTDTGPGTLIAGPTLLRLVPEGKLVPELSHFFIFPKPPPFGLTWIGKC